MPLTFIETMEKPKGKCSGIFHDFDFAKGEIILSDCESTEIFPFTTFYNEKGTRIFEYRCPKCVKYAQKELGWTVAKISRELK